jgi:hypothetical protein
MSRILLAIGLASSKAAAEPELVYLGRSGDAMRAALARATQPRLIIVPHLQGIPKNNPRAATNEAAAAAELAAEEKIEATANAQLATELAETKQLLALAEDGYTAANTLVGQRNARVAELEAQLAAAAARIEALTAELAAAKAQAAEPAPAPVAEAAPAAAPVPASPDPAPAPETPAASSSAESGEERPPRRRR